MGQKVSPIRSLKKIKQMYSLLRGQDRTGRNSIMFFLGINVALRITDLLSLKYSDIFYEDTRFREFIHIKIGKDKGRKKSIETKKLNEKLRIEVKKYAKKNKLSGNDWFFFSHRDHNNNLKRGDAWKIMNKAGTALNIEKCGTHTLRQTFGYHHYLHYQNIAVLMRLFGHRDPSYTLRYIGIEEEQVSDTLTEIGEIYDFK